MALTKIQPFGIDSTKVFAFAGVTLTGNVTATNANLGNIVVANYFSGDGSSLTNVAALTSQTVTTAAQPNITSVGTLTSLAVSGDITGGNVVVANYFTGNGSLLTGLVATTAQTVTTAAQPNITSVGTLTSLVVTGNITSGNAALGNLATASFFSGSGNLLSNIQGGNVTGAVGLATFATTANAVAGANVSGTVANATYSVTSGTALSVDGANVTGAVSLATFATTANAVAGANVSGTVANATYATTSGTSYSVDGANVTGAVGLATFATTANAVAGANVSGTVANATFATSAGSATTAGTVTTAAQPNITSIGTLTGLVVSGDATITGNLSISGSTIYANVTTLNVQDPIIEQGGGANGTSLSTNDGKDRGQLLHYYTTLPVDAFMGWDNSNAEFAFGSNVTTNNDVVTFNQLGNVRGSYFLGNGSALASITGANVTGQVANALVAGTVTDAAQTNITSVGTLTSLTVSGNIIGANAALGNLVTANFFSGNGSLLTGLTATNANTANTANSATTAGTVTTAAQPNITTVGTLTSLAVTGNISAGNISGGNVVVANYFLGDGGLLSNIASADNISSGNSNVRVVTSGNISMSVAGTTNVAVVTSTGININGYANITGNVTFGNLAVTAFANLGSVSGLTITGGSDGYVLQTNGTGGVSWAPLGALVTVSEFTGNGVQTIYTLTTTPASEDYTLVNINGAQQLRSSYTVTGNAVTFSEAPPVSSSVEVTTFAQRPTVAGYVTRKFTGNGSGTTYTVTAGTGESDVLVFLNGICQTPVEDYTISANVLTFSSPVANNVVIQVRELPR
jgi:hypothetical protein